MLDLRNATLGMRERHPELSRITYTAQEPLPPLEESEGEYSFFASSPSPMHADELTVVDPTPHPQPVDLDPGPSDRPRISLQDMVSASIALKSSLDVEILGPSATWPTGIFPTATSSPSKGSISLPSENDQPISASTSLLQPEPRTHDDPLPHHVVQAISGLQREVLLLRNELNFELWLSRENVRHIGRLYQDRILSKNAEAERQGLVRFLCCSI